MDSAVSCGIRVGGSILDTGLQFAEFLFFPCDKMIPDLPTMYRHFFLNHFQKVIHSYCGQVLSGQAVCIG